MRATIAIAVTAVVVPAVDAVFGAITLKFWLGQSSPEFWSSLTTWWASDAIGVMTVLPAVLALHRFSIERNKPFAGSISRRIPLVAGCTLVVGFLVFWSPWGGVALFLLFPVLLGAAVLLGGVGANSAALVLVTLGAFSTCLQHGPFANGSLEQNLLQLDFFALSVPFAAMLLSVLSEEGSLLWPGIVLLAGCSLSGWLFSSLTHQRLDFDNAQFRRLEASSEKDIQERMATYTEALIGTASFLSASGQVSREQWKSWVESQRLLERYSGLRGIWVVEKSDR